MRFTVDRKKMAGICRNLMRIVPDTSPIADLTGILIEADENTGNLNLTANNQEIAIQYDCTARIEAGGKMVLNARLLSDMMPLLAGEHVLFDVQNGGIAHIQSESANFYVSCLPGTHYPKPEVPAPENTVQISGIGKLAKQTVFAAKKPDSTANIYSNVKLLVFPTEIHMIATDTVRLALARHKQISAGNMTLLIPISALSVLAGVAGDEPMQAGMSQNSLVFKGDGFVFTSRTMQGAYMDVNEILKSIQPQYDALVPARDLWRDIDSVGVMADGITPIHLILREDGISLSWQGESAKFHTVADAVVYRPTPEAGFHYKVNSFLQALRYMEGNIRLSIDRSGMLLLKSEDQCYLFSPVRPRKAVVAKQQGGKKKDKKNKTANAA